MNKLIELTHTFNAAREAVYSFMVYRNVIAKSKTRSIADHYIEFAKRHERLLADEKYCKLYLRRITIDGNQIYNDIILQNKIDAVGKHRTIPSLTLAASRVFFSAFVEISKFFGQEAAKKVLEARLAFYYTQNPECLDLRR